MRRERKVHRREGARIQMEAGRKEEGGERMAGVSGWEESNQMVSVIL